MDTLQVKYLTVLSIIFFFMIYSIILFQRTESVTSLVKRGEKEARLVIELFNSEEEGNWVVGSVFTDRGKVSWTINGEKVTKSQVEELVSRLNIQVSTDSCL